MPDFASMTIDYRVDEILIKSCDRMMKYPDKSSGRQGSAIANELIDLPDSWCSGLLELAYELSNQVNNDWQTYSQSYNDGIQDL